MTEEELASIVTEDIQAGKSLDLRSFVGGTLFSIAEAMQINLTEEIQSSSEIQAELTVTYSNLHFTIPLFTLVIFNTTIEITTRKCCRIG